MEKIKFLPFLIALTMITACHPKDKPLGSGIDVTNLDTTVAPGADFFQYACGGWMDKNPLTAEYARFTSFDKLAESNRMQLNTLIETIAAGTHEQGDIEQKIADVYNLAMDSAKLNSEGYTPIAPRLAELAKFSDREAFSTLIPALLSAGVNAYFIIYVDADPENSAVNLLQTYQGGISLPQRDYYLDEDENTTRIRDKYRAHVTRMFELTGFDAAQARRNMEAVLRIETRLARVAYDNVKLRDPYANYNKVSVATLQEMVPAINWPVFFAQLGLETVPAEVNVSQKESLLEVGAILATEPVESHIAYLQWKLINHAAGYLSDELYAEHFDFYGRTLSGKEEPKPRWKRAVDAVNDILGEAVGQMYVKAYFSPAAKERMIKLVTNLREALGQRIQSLSWMSDETKSKAQEKLATFYVKIGYPDKWRDYSALDVHRDSYYDNIVRATQFEFAYMMAKAGKPVDKDEWLMTPQTVNAYYNPATNEICFPAGILQYPFFSMEADDAFNYGAIGVVIGHEMTHGFDDQGRQYDKNGNLSDWWTEEDAARFNERAQVMADYFDAIEVAPGVHANGRFTLGENIADYGGLQVSFQAFQTATAAAPLDIKDGFTPEQRFFLAYATVWAGNIRPEEILVRTKSDPHSLGRWRVNGALPHIPAWYDAFNISEDSPLYLPPARRTAIW
ncbi:MAG: M13 family metallopeptidase [Tannerellaceae bacterium]|jgi:putative endopeptidase|nr:M13 family metallopeptidase [Tannerellaceae bacterium]